MDDLLTALVRDKGFTEEEALEQIEEAKDLLNQYLEEGDEDAAYNICEEMWGLEPDYLDDLLF